MPDRFDSLPTHRLGDHTVKVADTRRSRMQGLARLDALPAKTALHIPKCRSVHTFTMRFPLDLIWLDKHGKPVRVDESIPPRRIKTCLRARSVVECDGGTADGFLAAGLDRLAL